MGALAKKQIVNLYNRQKMRTFIVILATIALCTALPSTEDEIVPEMSLIQAKEEYDAHADAVASLEFLQTTEGRSKNACESLAKDTIKEIDNSIKTQQNMLNKLYKGERCHTEGKAAYDQAKRRKTDADRKLSTANKRLRDASNYQVDFGRYTFSGLREGSCGAFYNDRSYVNAKANYKRRQREQTQATGAQKTAVKNQNDARAAHLKAVEKCRCAVKDQHARGWTAANRNNANNAKAWKKAKHMLCVLADTPASPTCVATRTLALVTSPCTSTTSLAGLPASSVARTTSTPSRPRVPATTMPRLLSCPAAARPPSTSTARSTGGLSPSVRVVTTSTR